MPERLPCWARPAARASRTRRSMSDTRRRRDCLRMYRYSAATDMQDHFVHLADSVAARMRGSEGFLARYAGEKSRFVRFNRAAIRQAGTVEQRYLALELFDGRRHASQTLSLTGNV